MWSSSPQKSDDPAEEAQADYHFHYVGKELHCRSEYLFSGDWQTVTTLALKARDERPLQPGFRVKKIATRPGGEVEYEWGWTIPTLLQFVLRASEFIWSEVVKNDTKSQRLSIVMENKNLRSWGTFHEVSEYFVDKTKGKSFTAFQKKCRCSKPFFVPWKLVEAYGIKYLNYAYQSREEEEKIVKEHIRYLQKEKRKVETKKMLVTDGAVSEDMPLKQGLPLQQTKFKSNGYEEEGNETIDVAILTNTSP
eukprot:g10031.t1